jgi:hypothetical protein
MSESLCRSRSLTTVVRKLAKCILDLVGVQMFNGTKEALQEQGIILFSMERGIKIINWEQVVLYGCETWSLTIR